jgi:predicted SnoaL-like aldol condensation-catalyzing enzyme
MHIWRMEVEVVSAEANKAVVDRYFREVWNEGNLSVVDEIIGLRYGSRMCGAVMSGPDAVKLFVATYRETFPGRRFTILSMRSESDIVEVAWAHHGVGGGRRTALTGLSVYRLAEGKIVEGWVQSDQIGEMEQMGVRGRHDEGR